MTNEELVKQIQNDINQADNLKKLYQQNYGYICKIARKYAPNKDDAEDFTQTAYFGLYKAAMRFDSTREVKFLSYAVDWIRSSITRYIDEHGKCIRLPSYLHSNILQYKRFITAYQIQEGCTPTDVNICQGMNISQKALDTIKQAYVIDSIQSLDEPIPNTEETTLVDTVQDKSTNVENSVIDSMMHSIIHTDLWQIIEDNVTQREYRVLTLRYRDNMTLEAIGKELSYSRERIRHIEIMAMKKLRSSRVKRILSEKFGFE